MDHVAIMKPSWKLIPMVLSGEKTIESRWYVAKFAPWKKIKEGEIVYFKDAGKKITAKAIVEKVEFHENYDFEMLSELIEKYGERICFTWSKEETLHRLKSKKYCILIFLKIPQEVIPFNIDKAGFGNAAAWICVEDIEKITIQ